MTLYDYFYPVSRSLAIFLSLALLVNAFGPSVFYFQYQLEREHYAEELCENKIIPTCEGRCHMREQMKQTEHQKKEQTPNAEENRSFSGYLLLAHNSVSPGSVRPSEKEMKDEQEMFVPAVRSGHPSPLLKPPGQ